MKHKQSLIQTNVRNRGFFEIFVVLVVLLVFVAGGYYLLHQKVLFQDKLAIQNSASSPIPSASVMSPKPTPSSSPNLYDTTGWKVYTNKQLEFTLKYPDRLVTFEKNGYIYLGLPESDAFVLVRAYDNDPDLSLKQWVIKYRYGFPVQDEGCPIKLNDSDLVLRERRVDGQEGIDIDVPDTIDSGCAFWYLPVTFFYSSDNSKILETRVLKLNEGETILSTFKFTK